jgi:hypothetical protein
MELSKEAKDAIVMQGASAALGTVMGAVTKQTITRRTNPATGIAAQVGSAVGSAAARGAGVSGSLAAGAAVVTGKVAAVTVVATAAAPFVIGAAIVGGAGYGIYRLFKR